MLFIYTLLNRQQNYKILCKQALYFIKIFSNNLICPEKHLLCTNEYH